jgi:hypothetical protein
MGSSGPRSDCSKTKTRSELKSSFRVRSYDRFGKEGVPAGHGTKCDADVDGTQGILKTVKAQS